MLGNFGARGKQEHGRELCADFLWLFARVQFSLAVSPFAVFLFCPTRQGPESPFPGKEGFGVQKPPFPLALTRPGKGSFLSKNPHFPCVPLEKKGGFFDRNSLFQAEGKGGFLDPETLFSRSGDSGPCLVSGESQP